MANRDFKGEFVTKRGLGKVDYTLSWVKELGDDTIASSSWTVPSGIVEALPAPSFDAQSTTIWLSGGSADEEYDVTNEIVTVGGRELTGILRVKVLELVEIPPPYTETQLYELRKAYSQGVNRIRYGTGADQKEVEFRSAAEMRQLITEIEEAIVGSGGGDSKRFSMASYRRG